MKEVIIPAILICLAFASCSNIRTSVYCDDIAGTCDVIVRSKPTFLESFNHYYRERSVVYWDVPESQVDSLLGVGKKIVNKEK